MKKIKKIMILMACAMLVMMPVSVKTASAATAKTKTSSAPVQNGWYKCKNGNTKYYKKGKYLTGCQKIGKYTYLFSRYGNKMTKNTSYNGSLYYLDDNAHVMGWRKGAFCYYNNGKRMSRSQSQEYIAYQNARRVVQALTNNKMSKSQKLEVCFRWVMRRHYGSWRRFDEGGSAWYAVQANDMFERGRGDCIGYASAFAYIAKVLGYKNVYICANAPRSNNHAHAWTEINGRVYDPLYAGTDGYRQNYNVRYNTYIWYYQFRKRLA